MLNNNIDNKSIEDFCRQNGIEFLGLFGSASRNDASDDSDVDLLVRYKNGEHPSLFEKSSMTQTLKEKFGRDVDLVAQEFVDPLIRDKIYSDLMPLYGNP